MHRWQLYSKFIEFQLIAHTWYALHSRANISNGFPLRAGNAKVVWHSVLLSGFVLKWTFWMKSMCTSYCLFMAELGTSISRFRCKCITAYVQFKTLKFDKQTILIFGMLNINRWHEFNPSTIWSDFVWSRCDGMFHRWNEIMRCGAVHFHENLSGLCEPTSCFHSFQHMHDWFDSDVKL